MNDTTTQEPTPRPWGLTSSIIPVEVLGANDKIVAVAWYDEASSGAKPTYEEACANAVLIVKAVNAYDGLIAAMKEARQTVMFIGCHADDCDCDGDANWAFKILDEALTAAGVEL